MSRHNKRQGHFCEDLNSMLKFLGFILQENDTIRTIF